MDLTELLGAGQLTAAGFGFVCMIALLTGRLITLREHRETRADRDFWRKQAGENLELAQTALDQNTQLLQGAKLATGIAQALPQAVEAVKEQAT